MRLVFMGTPEYAVPALQALIDAGHDVACVYAQPARPSGRGQAPKESPVARLAVRAGLSLRTPASLKDAEEQAVFAHHQADAAVTVAYGLLLPKAVLAAPRLGCINAHASLLPRWRGAAPIQRAIMAGDVETGVSIMRMDEGLDTGPVLSQRAVPIDANTTAGTLHDLLAALSARMLIETLAALGKGPAAAQDDSLATYAKKLDKAEARLDWKMAAVALERIVRAMAPFPGAWFAHDGQRIKVLSAEASRARHGAAPGTVLDDRLTIACAEDTCLRPLTLQRAGKAPVGADAFLRGYAVAPGTKL